MDFYPLSKAFFKGHCRGNMGKHEGKVKLVMRKGDLESKVISDEIQNQQAAKARGEDNVCGHNAVSRMAQRQLASVRGKVKGCP